MAWQFGTAASAALVKLACPHCHSVQARGRKPRDERYRCSKCHRLFTRDEGEEAVKRQRR